MAFYTGTMGFLTIVVQSIIEPFSTRTICFLPKILVVNLSGVDADSNSYVLFVRFPLSNANPLDWTLSTTHGTVKLV